MFASRCSCDECNIVRLVASGIVSPELTEQLSHEGATVTPTPSYCFADMLPQMLTAGAGDAHLHNQLPMMFGPAGEYAYVCHNYYHYCNSHILVLQCTVLSYNLLHFSHAFLKQESPAIADKPARRLRSEWTVYVSAVEL